ncbi:Inosose dehydratase [Thalassoglobus neptunius]|uniref:Inosose dehydratase n=1 Tax=Thalassoglobus neptunius TaxID=1938619 RepID=A0A5C5WGQ7_9PLAN|nr:sugar phosphate isomerase/epimerase family protein [Thalassoglobus neptunius]TWT49974.1 Inosose dehydratase [Thalassoglobus neptunius]
MILSCFTNSYGRFGPPAAFELLASAGITHVELAIKNAGVPSFFGEQPVATDQSTEAEIVALSETIQQAGLKLSSCNVTSGNPLLPEVFQATLKKIDHAARLGVSLIVAGGGAIEDESEWEALVSHLRQIGDRCADSGIIYCCETHPGTCQNAERMLELMERVDHNSVRINFDPGNLFYYNETIDLWAEQKKVAPFIRHVHLKDCRGKFEDWYFPALGEGEAVDFEKLRTVLVEQNYSGPCSLEVEGIQGEPPLTLEQTHERIVQSVEHLKQTGWTIN